MARFMERNVEWLHKSFGIRPMLRFIPKFESVAFFPRAGDEGIGVPAAKAREIIETLGGPEKFLMRKVAKRHLVVRALEGVDFKKVRELAGPNNVPWAKKGRW